MIHAGRGETWVGRVRHVLRELLFGYRHRNLHDLVLRAGAGAHGGAVRRR